MQLLHPYVFCPYLLLLCKACIANFNEVMKLASQTLGSRFGPTAWHLEKVVYTIAL